MSVDADRPPEIARRARRKYRLLIEPIRATAKKCGYAIGVHGSLARDIDLIAVPWTLDAVPAEDLAARLIRMIKRRLGRAKKNAPWHVKARGENRMVPTEAFFRGHVVPPSQMAKRKPHGRRCWSIHVGGGPYIDLSVMPRKIR